MLATLLLDTVHPWLKGIATALSIPWWLDGFMLDGVYLATAWVIAVMLPPMAIFFPLFTLLEDFGYLPRVAFNLDSMFQKAGAHGKQALTMAMGFGCNAAGVVATRIIDSPRERLIAIITNNFSLCNGRWPTQILIATIFIGAKALFKVLQSRGLEVGSAARRRLMACTNLAQLERWLGRAAKVQSVQELLKPKPRSRPAARTASPRGRNLKTRKPRARR
jgi:ferrous iron transport protein B